MKYLNPIGVKVDMDQLVDNNENQMNSSGLLNGLRCYLSGPIENADDCGGEWRKQISEFLHSIGVFVLDPLNKPIHTDITEGKELHKTLKQFINDGEFDKVASIIKTIRAIDLRLCDVCDFVIAYIDKNINTCGTWEEIFLCNRQKKPILLVCKQGVKNIPLWMFGTIPHSHMFSSFDDLIQYLTRLHQNIIIERQDRWRFLDYTQLYCTNKEEINKCQVRDKNKRNIFYRILDFLIRNDIDLIMVAVLVFSFIVYCIIYSILNN